jgi:hypothetical protein
MTCIIICDHPIRIWSKNTPLTPLKRGIDPAKFTMSFKTQIRKFEIISYPYYRISAPTFS